MQLETKYGIAGLTLLAVSALSISNSGIHAIQQVEQLRKVAYLDAVKVPTVCYGSTRGVTLGMYQTELQCRARLKADLAVAERDVKLYVKHGLTQNQYDALVSFVFNVGGSQFKRSTLLTKINKSDCQGAGNAFGSWVYGNGKKLRGLEIRRENEAELWRTGCSLW